MAGLCACVSDMGGGVCGLKRSCCYFLVFDICPTSRSFFVTAVSSD